MCNKLFMTLVFLSLSISYEVNAEVKEMDLLAWIKTGYEENDCTKSHVNYNFLHETEEPIKLHNAWKHLKKCRDKGVVDISLTAAEHFLFIRSVTSKTGDKFYEILPNWYDTFKQFANWAGLEKHLRTSNQPTSKPDAQVVFWGIQGVTLGLSDYKKRTKEDPKYKARALKTGFYFIKDSFY